MNNGDAFSGEKLLHQHCSIGTRIIVQQEKIHFRVQFWPDTLHLFQKVVHNSCIVRLIYSLAGANEFLVGNAFVIKKRPTMSSLPTSGTTVSLGGSLPTHYELCRFISGSYAKHHNSSPITIFSQKYGSFQHDSR